MSERPVGALASAVLGDFEFNAGRPRLPEAKLAAWANRLTTEVVADRDGTVAELMAFGLKLVREIGEAGHEAVGQLFSLAGILMIDFEKARAMFRAAGLDLYDPTVKSSEAPKPGAIAWPWKNTDWSSGKKGG